MLTLLCSEDREERRVAVDCENKGDLSNRNRVHGDTFNPDALTLTELCSWNTDVYEPVNTCQLSLQEISQFMEQPMEVPYRPVHGQKMERDVKQVTRACESAFGQEARDGFIRAGVANRQVMPKNDTKKHLARMVGQ